MNEMNDDMMMNNEMKEKNENQRIFLGL